MFIHVDTKLSILDNESYLKESGTLFDMLMEADFVKGDDVTGTVNVFCDFTLQAKMEFDGGHFERTRLKALLIERYPHATIVKRKQ